MNLRKLFISLILIYFLCGLITPSLTLAEGNSNQITTVNKLQMQADIHTILKDPRFNYPDYFLSLKNFWHIVTKFLDRFKPKVPDFKLANIDHILDKLLLGLVIILPVIIVFFISKLWSKEKTILKNQLEFHELHTSYHKLISRAVELEKEGLYSEAIRYLYQAVLLYLKERNLIPKKNLTSDNETRKQLKKTVGSEHQIFVSYSKLLFLFQEKWYGLKSCMLEDSHQAAELTNLILSSNQVNLTKHTGDKDE